VDIWLRAQHKAAREDNLETAGKAYFSTDRSIRDDRHHDGMLLAMLSMARERERRAVCISNLRQFAIAGQDTYWQSYFSD
jgi:hypothetical protein